MSLSVRTKSSWNNLLQLRSKPNYFIPDIYLLFDTNGHSNTRLHDKRDDFNFAIIIVPPRDSYLPTAPACEVYI
jgi:hypothetical protein